MKKIKISIAAIACVLTLASTFAFSPIKEKAKDSTGWFELNPTTGALITPAVSANPDDCAGGSHYCAGEYNISGGQPTGGRIAVVMEQ